MTTPTTPAPSLEDRVTILETRLDTVLPTLATKEDIARLEGKIEAMAERFNGKTDRLDGKIDAVEERFNGKLEAMEERFNGKIDAMEERFNGKLEAMEERFNGKIVQLDAKIDAMGNRLLVRFSVVAFAMLSIAVAAAKYL